MRADIQHFIDDIKTILVLLKSRLDKDNSFDRLAELNHLCEDPNLWNDAVAAQKLMQERTRLDNAVGYYTQYSSEVDSLSEMAQMAYEEKEADLEEEVYKSLEKIIPILKEKEIETLLSEEADGNDCYLEIHAGSGGTESQDWAQILTRMYLRWGEKNGYKTDLIESTAGDVAGLKSSTILFKGQYAFGKMKTESGVHRLVRISPFDSNSRRHTSFSSAWIYPVVDDTIDIDIDPADLRIDVYRASGAGGQHVNTTESAVRITHQPSGIVVQCQNDRSQHKNRATCMQMLKSRLYEEELRKREEAAQDNFSAKTEIGWGHQIRSYVLQPYQMVKDLRTGYTSSAPSDVLDGDLNGFIAACLAMRIDGGPSETISDLEDD